MCTGTVCVPVHNKMFFSSVDGAFGIQSKDSMLYCIAIYKSYMYLSKSCRLRVAVTCACTL